MHDRLFEVACHYALQTPALHVMAARLSNAELTDILADTMNFGPDTIASICQEAWWRSLATLRCALAPVAGGTFDERVTQAWGEAFSDVYLRSFATEQEQAFHAMEQQRRQLAIECDALLQRAAVIMAPSSFSSLRVTHLLPPSALPSPDVLDRISFELLDEAGQSSGTLLALMAHKKLLSLTLLYFFLRRLRQTPQVNRALTQLKRAGCWFSLADGSLAEAQLREGLALRAARLEGEVEGRQIRLSKASQKGDVSDIQSLEEELRQVQESLHICQHLVEEVPRLVVEAQVKWQAMVGGFDQFSVHFEDLFEALHVGLNSPEQLRPKATSDEASALPPAPLRVQVEAGGAALVAPSGDDYPYVTHAAEVLPEQLKSLLDMRIAAYLDQHLEALVDARLEARWEAHLALLMRRLDVVEAEPDGVLPTPSKQPSVRLVSSSGEMASPPEPALPSEDIPPEPALSSEDIPHPPAAESRASASEEALTTKLPAAHEKSPQEEPLPAVPEVPMASTSALLLSGVPTLREFCRRVALVHRLWIEPADAPWDDPTAGLLPLAEPAQERLDLAQFHIHGRFRADKTQGLLEEMVGASLSLLDQDGALATPNQSSKSLMASKGKWAFTVGPRLYLVLKPPGKEGAPLPAQKSKSITYGKALAGFFEGDSRPVTLITAQGDIPAHLDTAKYRVTKLGAFFASHQKLSENDVLCLTPKGPDSLQCEIVYQDPKEGMESPDFMEAASAEGEPVQQGEPIEREPSALENSVAQEASDATTEGYTQGALTLFPTDEGGHV